MAMITCPQCRYSFRKGSWEVFTHCPECNAPWAVDPDEPARVVDRVSTRACVYAGLSFVPVLGLVFAVLGAFWGYLAVKFNRVVLGTTTMLLSVTVGFACQTVLIYWGIGQYKDYACQRDLTTLSNSVYAYRTLTHSYPPDLAHLANLRLPAPTTCPFSGGPYLYWNPSMKFVTREAATQATQAASQAATAPESPTTRGATTLPVIVWLTAATQGAYEPIESASRPAGDEWKTLMVAEVLPAHRTAHMCVTADCQVRAIPHRQFQQMLVQPENLQFARAFDKAWKAATQPAKKEEAKPASQPTTASSQPATASSKPTSSTASQPVEAVTSHS
jgi:hypothetical protein